MKLEKNLGYSGNILKINVDTTLLSEYANLKNLEIINARSDMKAIINRVNNYYFKNKTELIYIVLKLYLFIIDKKDLDDVKPVSFYFRFLIDKERIVLKTTDVDSDEIKITSFYSPFIFEDKHGHRILKSKFHNNREISTSELIILILYFEKSIFLECEKNSLLKQESIIEDIKNEMKSDGSDGYVDVDVEIVSQLVSELQFSDTSYLRYDIDLRNSLKLDEKGKIKKDRIKYHPPYHIDSDYRINPSYKIGFNRKISEEEFLKLFQLDKCPAKIIVEEFKEYGRLENDVKNYSDKKKGQR